MTARWWKYYFVRLSIFVALTALVAAAARPAAAGDLAKFDTSLKLIPADAAFYASMTHPRERFETIKNSNAWAKIMEMPTVQLAMLLYNAQAQSPGSPLADLTTLLDDPENREMVDVLLEMVSDEVFAYGDKDFIEFAKFYQIVGNAKSFAAMTSQLAGDSEEQSPLQIETRATLAALAQNIKSICVPDMVVGFKLKNIDRAKRQLAKLEKMATKEFDADEKTKGCLKRTKIGGRECYVLTLNGSMISWDDISLDRFKELEAKEGDVDKIIERIKKLKCVIAVCICDNYLVVSIGSSPKSMEKLGKGARLIDCAEFKPLAKYVDKPLVYVGYANAALNELFADQQRNVNHFLEIAGDFLPSITLNDEQKERLQKDVQSLASDIQSVLPKPGARMGLCFSVEQGVEVYEYAWDGLGDLDPSQPLSLLDHVGGDPLFGTATRRKVNVKEYDLLAKWSKIGHAYYKELVLPAMPKEKREESQKFIAAAAPLFERFDKVNRENLLPSLAGGQMAFILDGHRTSNPDKSAPAAKKRAWVVEPALAFSIGDAKLLTKAMEEYREILNGLIGAARQGKGKKSPPGAAIAEPTVRETPYGKIYSFQLPPEWRVNKKGDKPLVLSFGLSDKMAVLSATPDHNERLLKGTPLAVGGALAKADRPLAAAFWIHWAEVLDAARPWIGFVVGQAFAEDEADEGSDEMPAGVQETNLAVDALKALRNVSRESYLEDGALVHHTLLEIRDIEK